MVVTTGTRAKTRTLVRMAMDRQLLPGSDRNRHGHASIANIALAPEPSLKLLSSSGDTTRKACKCSRISLKLSERSRCFVL